MRSCSRCQKRWCQSALGLCRRCERETGDARTIADREREKVEREQQRVEALRVAPAARQPRTVIADGREYEVVWP